MVKMTKSSKHLSPHHATETAVRDMVSGACHRDKLQKLF